MTFNISGQVEKSKKANNLTLFFFSYSLKDVSYNAGENAEFIVRELALIIRQGKSHILQYSERRVLTNQSELCFCFQRIRCAFYKC